MSTDFFADIPPITLRGPRQRPTSSPTASTTRTGSCSASDGGASALRRLLLAHLLLAGLRHVRRRHVQPPVASPARTTAPPPRRSARSRSTSSRSSTCPIYCFHDVDVMADARQRRRASPLSSPKRSTISRSCRPRSGRKLLWGTANLFSHPRYVAGARDQPRSRKSIAFGRDAGARRARGDASPRRRELRAVGRSRGLRDAAQHRPEARARQFRPLPAAWSSSTSTRSASTARS